MKIKQVSVAIALSAALFFTSCDPYISGGYVGVNSYGGFSTGVAWTNASYDSNGFPIYGYEYGRPVYGYTSAGVAIFTVAALTALCYVPSWGPASWYRGSWRYPHGCHRYSAPPRYPHHHKPSMRPHGGMNAPIHRNPHDVFKKQPGYKPHNNNNSWNNKPGNNHNNNSWNNKPGNNHNNNSWNNKPGNNHNNNSWNSKPGNNHNNNSWNNKPGNNSKPSHGNSSWNNQPSRPNNVQPSRPNNVQPSRPNNVQPSRPSNVQPSRPSNVQPSRPNNVQHSRPSSGDHSRPSNVQHSRPSAGGHSRPTRR